MATHTVSNQPVKTQSGHRARRKRGLRKFLVTQRDRELLAFVAAHPFVLASHVQAWLGSGRSVCYRRLDALTNVGLLSHQRIFHAQPGCYQVTNGGLGIAGSTLPRPQVTLRTYVHDAGAPWLWLAAADPATCRAERILTEREIRHLDQQAEPFEDRFGLGLVDPIAREGHRFHYPDVLAILADGTRVAFELELSQKSRRALEQIFLAYSLDSRLRSVIYVTNHRRVASALRKQIAAFGLGDLVEVRYFDRRPGSEYWSDWPRQAVTEVP